MFTKVAPPRRVGVQTFTAHRYKVVDCTLKHKCADRISNSKTQAKYRIDIQAHITLCVFLTLRWLLLPTQIIQKCNANSLTNIALRFFILFG